MAEPFVGEIRMYSFQFAPQGWALCQGQTLTIVQNAALFSLLGTYYGGDGKSTFMLPDLRGRLALPMNYLSPHFGETGGEYRHTLNLLELPAHTHTVLADDNTGTMAMPVTKVGYAWAASSNNPYSAAANNAANLNAIAASGGGREHENMQPYIVLNFCIALMGIYPPRT